MCAPFKRPGDAPAFLYQRPPLQPLLERDRPRTCRSGTPAAIHRSANLGFGLLLLLRLLDPLEASTSLSSSVSSESRFSIPSLLPLRFARRRRGCCWILPVPHRRQPSHRLLCCSWQRQTVGKLAKPAEELAPPPGQHPLQLLPSLPLVDPLPQAP